MVTSWEFSMILTMSYKANRLQRAGIRLPQQGGNIDQPVNLLGIPNKIVLGMCGGCHYALVQTKQGDKCEEEIKDTLKHLPSCQAVILIGVAYGKAEYKFGDVLVSTAICGIVTPKFKGDSIDPRSSEFNCVPISDKLSAIFARNYHAWNDFTCTKSGYKSNVRLGDIVSVPWLIARAEIHDELLNNFPNVVGGEMEGLTLLKIQKEYNKQKFPCELEVIIIKGVADYADENKQGGKKWQFTAAKAAANYTKFKLEMNKGRPFLDSTNPPLKRIKKEKEE